MSRSDKYFKILKNGKPDMVSIDRLKPAFVFEENNKVKIPRENTKIVTQPRVEKSKSPESSTTKTKVEKVTKSEKVSATTKNVAAE